MASSASSPLFIAKKPESVNITAAAIVKARKDLLLDNVAVSSVSGIMSNASTIGQCTMMACRCEGLFRASMIDPKSGMISSHDLQDSLRQQLVLRWRVVHVAADADVPVPVPIDDW